MFQCLRFAVGVGSSGVCMFHVLSLVVVVVVVVVVVCVSNVR